MKRWTGLALFLLMAVLFLIANRGAYKGYFQDDELDNLSWAPDVPLEVYAGRLLTPQFQPGNFRPAGHFFFYLTGRAFGFDFRKYIFPIHALHLLNVSLLWLLLRRYGASAFASSAGALLFAFHMAVFDVYWKPMYVFDLLCGTFCLAALLFAVRGRWVLAFVAFWLGYKSKELAVMLPFVLLLYECLLGKRRWKPLIPFFAASLLFGVQALFFNPIREKNEYSFVFTPQAFGRTVLFYSGRLLLLPFAGLVLPFVPAVVKDRRVWFGIGAMLLFFAPLAFLPGRLFSAYCYVPLIGLAIALSGIAESHRLFATLFLVCWIPFNMLHLRLERRQALAQADENRRYVAALREFAAESPDTRKFVYDGRPFALRQWGIQGALNRLYRTHDVQVNSVEDKEAREALRGNAPVAILSWDPVFSKLTVTSRNAGGRDASFIKMDRTTPLWQLDEGWFQLEGGFRWTKPVSTARLYRPEGARAFALTANISPDHIHDMKRINVRLLLDGVEAGTRTFTMNGWQTVEWSLAPAPAGPVRVEFRADPYGPSGRDLRVLGLAIVSFGFVEPR